MVTNMDIHNIGFDYYGYPHTRRKWLPFTDGQLDVLARSMRQPTGKGSRVLKRQVDDIDEALMYNKLKGENNGL